MRRCFDSICDLRFAATFCGYGLPTMDYCTVSNAAARVETSFCRRIRSVRSVVMAAFFCSSCSSAFLSCSFAFVTFRPREEKKERRKEGKKKRREKGERWTGRQGDGEKGRKGEREKGRKVERKNGSVKRHAGGEAQHVFLAAGVSCATGPGDGLRAHWPPHRGHRSGLGAGRAH